LTSDITKKDNIKVNIRVQPTRERGGGGRGHDRDLRKEREGAYLLFGKKRTVGAEANCGPSPKGSPLAGNGEGPGGGEGLGIMAGSKKARKAWSREERGGKGQTSVKLGNALTSLGCKKVGPEGDCKRGKGKNSGGEPQKEGR